MTICGKVLLPIAIFNSIYQMPGTKLLQYMPLFLLVFAVVIIFSFGITFVLLHSGQRKLEAYTIGVCAAHGNDVMLGFPLANQLFDGAAANCYTALLPATVLLNSFVSAYLYSRCNEEAHKQTVLKGTLRNAVLSPIVIASSLGIVFSLCKIRLFPIADSFLGTMGNAATPLSLLLLGARLHFQSICSKPVFIGTVLKLILIPGVVLPIVFLLHLEPVEIQALMILFSLPTATLAYAMACDMSADSELANSIVVTTTVLSVITIPLWMLLLGVLI